MVEEGGGTWVGIVVVVEVVAIVDEEEGRVTGRDVEVEVDVDVAVVITILALEDEGIEGVDDVVKTTEEEDTDGRR